MRGGTESGVTGVTRAGKAGAVRVRGWSGVLLAGSITLGLCGPDDGLRGGRNMSFLLTPQLHPATKPAVF